MYAVNGCTSGVLPSAVARLIWAIPTPPKTTFFSNRICRNIICRGPLFLLLVVELDVDIVVDAAILELDWMWR